MGQARKHELNLVWRQFCQRFGCIDRRFLPDLLYSLSDSKVVRHSVLLLIA
jgi:hypothetical protein